MAEGDQILRIEQVVFAHGLMGVRGGKPAHQFVGNDTGGVGLGENEPDGEWSATITVDMVNTLNESDMPSQLLFDPRKLYDITITER
jgi:hypothetical protein